MFEFNFFFIYFCLIVSLQSAIGVGILVLGTPFLLIMDYKIIEIFFTLLPISIITSLLNLLIMKSYNNKIKKSSYRELAKFFKICIPSIIVGLLILKFFQEYINFKLLVSLVIILSVALVVFKKQISFKINFFRISVLSIVGIVHGLTNSGGTLMSLAISSNNKKDHARYNITLFYFILALSQYLITLLIFYKNFSYPSLELLWTIIIGMALGNLFNNFISEKKYKIVINTLAVISSFFLILK